MVLTTLTMLLLAPIFAWSNSHVTRDLLSCWEELTLLCHKSQPETRRESNIIHPSNVTYSFLLSPYFYLLNTEVTQSNNNNQKKKKKQQKYLSLSLSLSLSLCESIIYIKTSNTLQLALSKPYWLYLHPNKHHHNLEGLIFHPHLCFGWGTSTFKFTMSNQMPKYVLPWNPKQSTHFFFSCHNIITSYNVWSVKELLKEDDTSKTRKTKTISTLYCSWKIRFVHFLP